MESMTYCINLHMAYEDMLLVKYIEYTFIDFKFHLQLKYSRCKRLMDLYVV